MIEVAPARSGEELSACFKIRHQVFVIGQNVPSELEQDGFDYMCRHFIARAGDEAVGTARVYLDGGKAKVQRVAVLDAWRGQGVGACLMQAMLEALRMDEGVEMAILSSQVHAISFYEKFGFAVEGNEYMDAGIPHKDMILRF